MAVRRFVRGPCAVEVSLNGVDFTGGECTFPFLSLPVALSMPTLCFRMG